MLWTRVVTLMPPANVSTSPAAKKARGLPAGSAQVQYESLDRHYKGSISTSDADYILVIKSGGKKHNSIDHPETFFGTRAGNIVGVTRSKD